MRRPRHRLAQVVLFLLAASCGGGGGDGSTGPPPIDVTPNAIAISPSTPLTLASGATTSLTATVTTRDGHTVSGAVVTWSSSDPTVATANNGLVTAIKVGTATITASNASVSSSVVVTVVAGPASQLVLRTQPAGGALGSPLPTQPVVEVRDAAGNLVTSSAVTVTVAIAAGGGSLTGTTTASAIGGVATFTGLGIVGTAGPRTLGFASPGIGSVVSAEFTMVLPPVQFIVLDSASFTAVTQAGSNPASRTIKVSNGGSVSLTSVTVDPVVFDANQPVGWLTAAVTGASAPFTITLTFAATGLPVGTYHATVPVNSPGATNTPALVSVTLNVVPAVNVTYGSNVEKVRVLDAGGTFTPTVTALVAGQSQPITAVAFASRATSVVTVDANGRIAAVGPGQSWIVASMQTASDSVFVTVTRSAAGPLLRADLATYSVKAGDTITATFTLDPRGTPVAGATVVVGYETENTMFSVLSAGIPVQTPMPVGGNSTFGVFKITVGSANALAAPVAMLQLRLLARTSGLFGYLTFGILDIVGPDGTDVSPQTTSTRYPIIIR
ncbi:MAG: Ig-like domain-containing protein [bacterium]